MQLDLRGIKCPQSLIEAKLALRHLSTETSLTIILDDNASINDILRYIQRQHLEYDLQDLAEGVKTIFLSSK